MIYIRFTQLNPSTWFKQTRQQLQVAGLIIGCAAIILSAISLTAHAAGSTSLYLSPASSTTTVGNNLTVTVRENSGSTAVNAVEVDLSYPSSLLQYVSTDFGSSAFEIAASSSGGSGSVSMARGTVNLTLTGDQTVGTITFKALSSGSATVTLLNTSAVTATSNSTNTIGTMTGGTYTLQNPPATPPVTQPPVTPPSTSKSSSSSKSSSTSSTTKTTTTPTTPSTTTTPVTQPVTTYLVAIKVLNNQGHPQVGAQVTLGSSTVVSDATGIASFPTVTSGSHQVTIKYGTTTQKELINVSSAKSPTSVQQFQYRLTSVTAIPVAIWLVIGIILIIVSGVVIKFIRHSRLRSDFAYSPAPATVFHEGNPMPPTSTPTNVGQIVQPTTPNIEASNPPIESSEQTDKLH